MLEKKEKSIGPIPPRKVDVDQLSVTKLMRQPTEISEQQIMVAYQLFDNDNKSTLIVLNVLSLYYILAVNLKKNMILLPLAYKKATKLYTKMTSSTKNPVTFNTNKAKVAKSDT